MTPNSLLIANRGEIAIRIIRAAAEMGIRTVANFPARRFQFAAYAKGRRSTPSQRCGCGPRTSMESRLSRSPKRLVATRFIPVTAFSARTPVFSRRCAAVGITFVGPRAEILELFGDKAPARALAERCGVPILRGTSGATTLDDARRFFTSVGRRRFDDESSARRRRWVAACGPVSRIEEIDESIQALPVGGARASFGKQRSVRRAVDAARTSHRSADHR